MVDSVILLTKKAPKPRKYSKTKHSIPITVECQRIPLQLVNAKLCYTQIHTYLGSFHIIFDVECFRQHMRAISIPLAFAMQFTSIKVVSPLRASSTMCNIAVAVAYTIYTQTRSPPFSSIKFSLSLKQNQMGFIKNNRYHGECVFVCALEPFCTRDHWLLVPRKNNNCCDNNKDRHGKQHDNN